jgi:hypothetical protein
MECGRVRILDPRRVAMGQVVVAEPSVRPVIRNQDKIPVCHPEAIAEFLLQTPQADRRVVAPGSEVVGINRDLENHGITEGFGETHRLPRHVGQGHSDRRKL